MTETASREPAHVRQARYLGADAALAAASWLTMSEDDARSILDDVDPKVMDRYGPPNLSGEWADDPTPVSVAHDVGANDGDIATDLLDDIADAWEDGRDRVWHDAVQAVALRTLGRTDDALRVERDLEATADRLREASEADATSETTGPRRTIRVAGAKGGVGTTTVTALLALLTRDAGRSVAVVGGDDLFGTLGLPTATVDESHGLRVVHDEHAMVNAADGVDIAVIDNGRDIATADVIVTTNEYLSLRHVATAVELPAHAVVVVRMLPGRVLSVDDIRTVVRRRVVTVDDNAALARAVDAGLLVSRVPDAVRQQVCELTAGTVRP